MFMVGFAALQYSSAYSRSIQPSSFRSFSVSGEGKSIGIPDVAEFSFAVVTQGGKDIGALQTDNTEKANAVIAFVKSNGVESKDIKTEAYDLSPRYQYANCGGYNNNSVCPPPEIVGYTVTQAVSIKVRDFTKTGTILSGVIGKGANSVSQLNFKIDDPTEVQNMARAEAVEKAKAKAVSIAKAGGFRIGRLLSIEEGGGYYPAYYERGIGIAADAAGAPKTTIEPGSEDVNVTVTLRYEIR